MGRRLCVGILICFLFIDMLVNKNSGIFLKGFTQLEKLINNILAVKIGKVNKKLLYLKQKNSSVFLTGFTLIEVLIVIAIIAVLSVYYVINLRPNTIELLKMDTNRLAADIRYIRSMTTSRATYNGVFPEDGYGILFKNGNGTTVSSYYIVFAGSVSNEIKRVTLSKPAFRLVDPNSNLARVSAISDTTTKTFSFTSENTVQSSGLELSADGDYQLEIYYGFNQEGAEYYYLSRLDIGRRTADNFVWSNLAINYAIHGVACGNGIVETGESCERFAEDGTTIVNANCFPDGFLVGGVAMGCKSNSCGDGVIAGTETCERGVGATGGLYYENRCANVPHYNWCYTCSASNTGICRDMSGASVGCCLANANAGTCTDCQWNSAVCFREPRICPILE